MWHVWEPFWCALPSLVSSVVNCNSIPSTCHLPPSQVPNCHKSPLASGLGNLATFHAPTSVINKLINCTQATSPRPRQPKLAILSLLCKNLNQKFPTNKESCPRKVVCRYLCIDLNMIVARLSLDWRPISIILFHTNCSLPQMGHTTHVG